MYNALIASVAVALASQSATIQKEQTTVTTTEAAMSAGVGPIEKIKFSHYFQSQFRDTNQAGKAQHSFEVRRFRFGMSMEVNPQASIKASYDLAAGTNRSTAELKDAAFLYKPIGTKGLTLTAGQFVSPIGYETPTSSSALEFPERVTYNKTMFNDERLRGFYAEQKLEGGFSIYGGIANALTTKDAEQAALAPGAGARMAGFAGVKYHAGDAQYGLGYFSGKRPEFTGGGGTSPEVDRSFFFADAQVTNIMNSGLYVRGELMTGKDRVPSTTGGPLKLATDMTGYLCILGYELEGGHALFTRYSVFDPNTDTDSNAISELGFGYRHSLGSGANLTLAHEIYRDPSVANSPYNVTTLRLQFKF